MIPLNLGHVTMSHCLLVERVLFEALSYCAGSYNRENLLVRNLSVFKRHWSNPLLDPTHDSFSFRSCQVPKGHLSPLPSICQKAIFLLTIYFSLEAALDQAGSIVDLHCSIFSFFRFLPMSHFEDELRRQGFLEDLAALPSLSVDGVPSTTGVE
jgi:hypothetical protein